MPVLLPVKEHLKTMLEDYFCVEHGDKPDIDLSANVMTINCCPLYADMSPFSNIYGIWLSILGRAFAFVFHW